MYKGSVPVRLCSEVTGKVCDRPFPLDAATCGILDHVAPPEAVKRRGLARWISRPGRHKPRLTVNEDYDLVGPMRDPERDVAEPDLDPETFDASQVWVGTQVQSEFTSHHNTEPDTAIEEIRLLLTTALKHGKYRRTSLGDHRLEYEKFGLVISPNGAAVTQYWTFHFERTPSQVFDGVPSRFRTGGAGRGPKGRTLSLEEPAARRATLLRLNEGQIVTGPVTNLVNFGAFVDLGGVDGLVHLTEMPDGFQGKPADNFSVGQELTLRIISVDADAERVGLSLRSIP